MRVITLINEHLQGTSSYNDATIMAPILDAYQGASEATREQALATLHKAIKGSNEEKGVTARWLLEVIQELPNSSHNGAKIPTRRVDALRASTRDFISQRMSGKGKGSFGL